MYIVINIIEYKNFFLLYNLDFILFIFLYLNDSLEKKKLLENFLCCVKNKKKDFNKILVETENEYQT